jgi:hypothetical protein
LESVFVVAVVIVIYNARGESKTEFGSLDNVSMVEELAEGPEAVE